MLTNDKLNFMITHGQLTKQHIYGHITNTKMKGEIWYEASRRGAFVLLAKAKTNAIPRHDSGSVLIWVPIVGIVTSLKLQIVVNFACKYFI